MALKLFEILKPYIWKRNVLELLVVVPLIIIFLMEHIEHVFKGKGDKYMEKIKNAFDALNVLLNCIINLSGNIAGGALLANVF